MMPDLSIAKALVNVSELGRRELLAYIVIRLFEEVVSLSLCSECFILSFSSSFPLCERERENIIAASLPAS
jgi:hypothetical protein